MQISLLHLGVIHGSIHRARRYAPKKSILELIYEVCNLIMHKLFLMPQNMVAFLENELTGANESPCDEGMYSGVAKHYLPERVDIDDLLIKWKQASRSFNMYPAESDADGEDDALYDNARYIGKLHDLSREFIEEGHLDLAAQALSEANFIENSQKNSQDGCLFISILHGYLKKRVEKVLDKPVYFVIDFDHTLARSNVAHENLLKATYTALPEEVKLNYEDFVARFEEAYRSHQKEAGMHNPRLMVKYLAKSLNIEQIPQEMYDAYDAYVNSFKGNMFRGVAKVLDRLNYLGSIVVLTFGDQLLQKTAVQRSGIGSLINAVNVTEQKSPKAILDVLRKVGYEEKGYIIGIGDKPSDSAAIKAFDPKAIAIRMRHPDGKYSTSEPKSPVERSDFEYNSFYQLDSNMHLVFQDMLRR